MVSFARCLTKALPVTLLSLSFPLDVATLRAQVNLTQTLAAREMEIYAKAHTVVDMTYEELLQAFPKEIGDLDFNDSQDELPKLLRSVGTNVVSLMNDIPNVGSKETVKSERLRNTLIVTSTLTQTYNYLVLSDRGVWEEIRTDSKGRPIEPGYTQESYFMSSGFAGLVLIFHTSSLTNSRFRILGRQKAEPGAYLIAFAQRPENGQPWGKFATPFLPPASIMYQGFAWVDPTNYQILRMRTDLLAPRRDVLLSRQTTEIWFSEVHFNSSPRAFWLPHEVLVTIEYSGQIQRNRHLYSEFLVFVVESKDKLEQPKIKK